MQVKTDIKYKFIILISILVFFYITLFNYSNFIEIHGNNVISTTSENTIIRKSEFNRSILYVSRHDGTISNFVNIAQRLSFNVTLMRPPVSNIFLKLKFI